MRKQFMLVALSCTLMACASLTVRRVPQPETETTGVRFYRPRPYLLVTESAAQKSGDQKTNSLSDAAVNGNLLDLRGGGDPKEPAPQQLSVQIVWLPDYSQEYQIIAKPGIGSVTFNPSLKDGWNLSSLSATVDTKTAEILTAVGGLITAAAAVPAAVPLEVKGEKPKGEKPKRYCPGLYPIHYDTSSGLITGLDPPRFVFSTGCQSLDCIGKPGCT